MAPDMQNPGVQAGASRDQHLTDRWLPETTASDWRVQILASRFHLLPATAREVANLCFGEGRGHG